MVPIKPKDSKDMPVFFTYMPCYYPQYIDALLHNYGQNFISETCFTSKFATLILFYFF